MTSRILACLVIGYGSAGKRHARVLAEMGHCVTVDTRQACPFPGHTPDHGGKKFDYTVIASATPQHARDLSFSSGITLVEKPLFLNAGENQRSYPFPVYVAYQLRFHPVVVALKKLLAGANIYSAHIYAGQNLSLWGGTYHTDKTQGGGVLRDYSHEFDLINYVVGRISDAFIFEHDPQDCACMAISTETGAAISAQFNYLDTTPRREWIIVTDKGTFKADLQNSTINGQLITGRDPTRIMHEAVLSGGNGVCSFEEGLFINQLIDRMES